jgi:hypothetical protein
VCHAHLFIGLVCKGKTMAFEVEMLTEEDRLRYNTDPEMMDLSKIPLKRWITDKERDISIWGGMHNHHWMAMAEGDDRWQFQLRYKQKIFKFIVWPASGGSAKYSEDPYIVRWASIDGTFPHHLHGFAHQELVVILKEALTAFA